MEENDPTTQELRREWLERERVSSEAARQADEAEAERHRARARKASYLREKLDARARSEREAARRG